MESQHISRLEAKTVEDNEKQIVRRLLWVGKFPGIRVETRAAAAPGPTPAGPAAVFLEENQVNSSLPCQAGRIKWHQYGPGCLKSLGGIKTKWQMHKGGVYPLRQWKTAGSLSEKLGSWVTPEEGRRVGL